MIIITTDGEGEGERDRGRERERERERLFSNIILRLYNNIFFINSTLYYKIYFVILI